MSNIDLAETRTQALQAAATLARYERHVRRLAATWLDMDLYRTVSTEIDAIGRQCLPLPNLARPWVALLTSHAELVHTLLAAGARAQEPGEVRDDPAAREAMQEHLACIDSLARHCLRVAEANHRAATATGASPSMGARA